MSTRSFSEVEQLNGIHYVVDGEGPPVILLHGVAASLHDWTRLVPALASAGFSAYAPDLPGHGESDKPDDPEQYHIEVILLQITRWLDSLPLERPVILLGHSLGGYLSLAYANRYPENVERLVLINPLYSPNQLSPVLQVARRRPALGSKTMRLVPEWLVNTVLGWDQSSTADFSPQARQQIANDYKRASPHFVYITKDISDLTPSLPDIQQPTCVIWGDRDMTLRPDSFPSLVDILPRASGIPIAHSGHQPHIGKPALVSRLVLEFLDALESSDSQATRS